MDGDLLKSENFICLARRRWFCLHRNAIVVMEKEESDRVLGRIEIRNIEGISAKFPSLVINLKKEIDELSIRKRKKKVQKIELLTTNQDRLNGFVKTLKEAIKTANLQEKPTRNSLKLNTNSNETNYEDMENYELIKIIKSLKTELEAKKKAIEELKETNRKQKNVTSQLKNIVIERLGHEALEDVIGNSTDNHDGKHFYKINHEKIKQLVDDEFSKTGIIGQFTRDTLMWSSTFESCNDRLKGLLIRILVTLKFGGLLIRKRDTTDWKWWGDTNYPVVAALSHGGRVMIQLGKQKEKKDTFLNEDGFWKWLITGKRDGYLSTNMSQKTSGIEAKKEKKIIFKRMGATHAIDWFKNDIEQETGKVGILRKGGEYYDFLITGGRKKMIIEKKVLGFSAQQFFSKASGEKAFSEYKNWGCNIPIGGENKRGLDGRLIKSDGSNGHLYLHYLQPKKDRYGGIMIGLEGSEFGMKDTTGMKHSMSGGSNVYSPTYGYKFFSKTSKDLRKFNVPDKYNGMFIDLSDGWEFLMDKVKEWDNSWIFGSTEIPKSIPRNEEEIKRITEAFTPKEKDKKKKNFLYRLSMNMRGKKMKI